MLLFSYRKGKDVLPRKAAGVFVLFSSFSKGTGGKRGIFVRVQRVRSFEAHGTERERDLMAQQVGTTVFGPRQPEHDACGIGAVVSIRGVKTYQTVDNALKIVEKLEHRAGKDAAGETGDGVGLMLQIPHKLMTKAAAAEGISLGEERDYGVGMLFLPSDGLKRAQAKKMLEIIVAKEGMEFLGWRDVPVDPEILGQKARDCMPCICQCFVRRPESCARGLEFERKLYVARRVFERSDPNT